MVATNAHIGNYGTLEEEVESDSIKIAGLVVKNFSYEFSRPGGKSLQSFLEENDLLAICDVDTRALVSYIRDNGAMNAVISTEVDNTEELKAKLAATPEMKGLELASKVSTSEPYFFGNPDATYKIAALDLGIKRNILRNLASRDAYIKVFPFDTPLSEMEAWKPNGYFLSNGPGDPEPLESAIKVASELVERNLPTFGICLGHQVLAISQGVKTFKMFNGHRGINHPVKNLETGKGEISSQNHGFAVEKESAEANPNVEITHLHLNDGTVAGIKIKDKNIFSVQYHPEASPGPNDGTYLFDQFISNLS